jgi:DNA end-binding protein Ku
LTTTEPQYANAPVRGALDITLQFGLVAIPVKLYTATEDTKAVVRKSFTVDNHEVGRMAYDKTTGQPVDSDAILMKVDVNGALIEFTDEEMAAVTAGLTVDRRQVEIETLVPLDQFHTRYVPDKTYQVRADKSQPSAQKGLRILLAALAHRQVAALVRFAFKSGPARYAAVTPDGVLHTLHFDNEVRAARTLDGGGDISDKELALADKLIDAIGVDVPNLDNPAAQLIADYLAEKAAGTAPDIATVDTPVAATIDLMAALEQSVAAAKAKPSKPKRKTSKAA